MSKLHFKVIAFLIFCIVLYLIAYPFYIRWIAGNYAKEFAHVLNSHDTKKYDKFFCEDTVFELNGRQIKYADAKENMEKVQTFTCEGSYGHLEEECDFWEFIKHVYVKKDYTVSLMLPVWDYRVGEHIITVGIIEGEMILKRKAIIFYEIEQVTFYDDREGFLKDFIGI